MESKLFRIVQSDGNDRDTYAHAKAYDIQDIIDWLHQTYFQTETLNLLDTTIESDTNAYISWTECGDCTKKECDFCEVPLCYLEITQIMNPDPQDYEYKTIYGTNQYYDLTRDQPKKAQDWNKPLKNAFSINPQLGVDMLQKLTLISQYTKQELTELHDDPHMEIKRLVTKQLHYKEGTQ